MRVAPRWRADRIGHITDIEAFVPGEEPSVPDGDGGAAAEPVTMMDYNASITYTVAGTPNSSCAEQANDEGRFLGLKCPVCGRTYTGGRGYCPVDARRARRASTRSTSRSVGTVTNYTIITPVQYPGQTETEPFARVHVWLDDTDVVLGYQPLLDTPNDDVRIGMRVAAVWASEAEKADLASTAEGASSGGCPPASPTWTTPTSWTGSSDAQRPTTSRSSAGTSRRWCAAPTRPKPRCSSR